MKKYLVCLIIVLGVTSASYGQNMGQLLKTASKAENVDKVKIGGFLMSVGKLIGGVSDMPVVKGVRSLEVYDLSDCNSKTKKDMAAMISNMKDGDGYETLMMAKDGGDDVRIFAKKKKDVISDIVILCAEESDISIVKLSGKIKESDIAELVNEYSK